jgi:hypothetical protein
LPAKNWTEEDTKVRNPTRLKLKRKAKSRGAVNQKGALLAQEYWPKGHFDGEIPTP